MSGLADSPLTPVQTVLCAVDLSESSAAVLRMAALAAETYDAKLLVVHAVELWDNRYDFVVADLAKRIEKDATERLQAELAHLGKSTPVPVEVLIAKGAPALRLMETIRDRRPDLVVVGKHGRRGIDRLLLGSVSDKILRTSPSSVLVVRPPRTPNFQRLLCAVDGSSASQHALKRALEIAQLHKLPRIAVLNVFELPAGYMEAGMTYESAFDQIRNVHFEQTTDMIKNVPGAAEMCDVVIREGSPAAAIAAYADELGSDLLVIGSHSRSSLTALLVGGTSLRVINHANTSVLAVKAPGSRESLWEALDRL